MDIYKIPLPDGRFFKVRGDHEPTPEEQAQIIQGLGYELPLAPEELQPGEAAARGATGIGPTPWHARNIGPLPSVSQVVGALPDVGGAIGGIVGAGAGGGTPASIPGAVGGAAVGGAAGEAARELIGLGLYDEPPMLPQEAALEMAKQGAMQGALEGTGQVGARVAGKLAGPFRSSLNSEVIEAAERQGIGDLPASVMSKSNLVPLAEAVSAKGFGGVNTARRHEAFTNALAELADHTVKRASKLQTPSEQGRAISKGYKMFKAAWQKDKAALYREIDLSSYKAETGDLVQMLDDTLKHYKSGQRVVPITGSSKLLATIRKNLASKKPRQSPVTLQNIWDAEQLLGDFIGSKAFADTMASEDKRVLLRIHAKMSQALDGQVSSVAPEVGERLAHANQVFRDGFRKISSAAGGKIHKMTKAGEYDKIAQAVANSNMSVDLIPEVMEIAGKEGSEAMRVAVLADLVSKARGATGTAGDPLQPMGLKRAMKMFGDEQLQALLTKEQYQALSDLSTMSAATAEGRRIMQGSQTAYLGRMGGYGAAGMMAFGSPALALKMIVGDVAFNKFVSSKVGQKWLTTGIPLSVKRMALAPHVASGVYHGATVDEETGKY